jgi:hypothetical protein
MNRALAVIIVVAAASAHARRVVHIPTIAELCSGTED